jgi:membrane associated rhomboid family serine protease
MGIQDRDYYRDNSHGFLESWGRQGSIVWIIVITSVVYFASVFGPGREMKSFGQYTFEGVASGELWRLVTPLFLHAGLWHLVFNMFVLYSFGTRVEELYGSRETFVFYLVAGIFAQGIYLASQLLGLTPLNTAAVGASGAVTAVLVLYALHFPHQRVLLFFVIPAPMWMVVILFIGLDLLVALGVRDPGVGYAAHLGGALFGFLYYKSHLRFTGFFTRSERATASVRVRPQLRMLPTEPEEDEDAEPVAAAVENLPRPKEASDEHFEAKVDRVLEKVSQHGQDSLTPEEREILVKASEMYKKRRK